MTLALQVNHLTTRLVLGGKPYKVVDDLSFSLWKGKTLALVGESGCGKSMAALSVMRILPQPPALPSEGEILYNGQNLLTLSEKEMRKIRGSRLAMIFQDPASALNPLYPIGDQLLEVAQLHLGLDIDEGMERVIQGLREVRIPNPEQKISVYPHQLSGGMKQRVMIAMALLCEPDVLIADEPTTALDVTVQAQVLELMRELQRRKGMAMLLITHDMGVVAEMADEVVVMYATQPVEQGNVYDIFDKKAHPYTAGLFQSLPNLHAPKEKLYSIKGTVPPITKLPSGCYFHPRCPYVMPICHEGRVPEFPVGGEGHTARCWLWDEKIKREQLQVKVEVHG